MPHPITAALPPSSLRACADARYPLMIALVAGQLSDFNWKQKQQQKAVVVVVVGIIYLVAVQRRMCVRACVRVCEHVSSPTPPACLFFEYTYKAFAAEGDLPIWKQERVDWDNVQMWDGR